MNKELMIGLSDFLNNNECVITTEMIDNVMSTGVSKEYAYALLLNSLYFNNDKEILNDYLLKVIKEQDVKEYINNPYLRNINFENQKCGKWLLTYEAYKPYEGFVYNDFIEEGKKLIPQIGFFSDNFLYPVVKESNRTWMLVTPNEINTMKEPINEAFGNVLTFGLGLGYFSYMVALKSDIKSITIVEKDPEIINLFKKVILPQFKSSIPIIIICDDAYHFMDNLIQDKYDYIFYDIWHDVSDGIEAYHNLKKYENTYPKIVFNYWIWNTLKYYI